MRKLTIGISMRESNASDYIEKRDSIARDWFKYINFIMPKANWVLLPNIENNIINYIQNLNVNGFILTGGEDIGISLERDRTEKYIYDHAIKNKMPILGICRGCQCIYKWAGGRIKKSDKEFTLYHKANKHEINFCGKTKIVNSYHSNFLNENVNIKGDMKILARCNKDNSVEAFRVGNTMGFMWHPEREKNFQEWETQIIRDFFNYEKK